MERWEAAYRCRGEPRVIPPGRHEIQILVAGRGEFLHDGAWLEVEAGDMLWFAPGQVVHARAGTRPFRCLVVTFAQVPEDLRPAFRTRWRPVAEAVLFAEEVWDAYPPRGDGATLLPGYVWNRLRWREARALAAPTPISPLDVAERHIAAHVGDPLPVSSIAAAAGISVPHLHALYRQHGTTPMSRVWDTRLRRLCDLLAQEEGPIGELAPKLGFTDAVHLSRRFKARYAMTPREFRRRCRQG